MDKKDKIEFIKFSIERFDHYYDSINNKGNLYLTLNTFLLGGIITGYYSIRDNKELNCFPQLWIWIVLILNLLGLLLTLFAIKPYLGNKSSGKNSSLIYFGSVSLLSMQTLHNLYSSLNEDKLYKDMIKQTHALSSGLRKKFNLLKVATYLLALEFLIIVIIGLYIFKITYK